MTIPTDGRLFWTGTHAGIPANWSRDTAFDNRFIQGADAGINPGTNGGTTTHSHTSNSHTHIQNAHSHTMTAPGVRDHTVTAGGLNSTAVSKSHGHTGASATTVPTNNSATPTITGTTAQPVFTRVIVISPDDALQDIPIDGIVLANSDISGTDLKITDGTASTTDLDGDFLFTMTTAGDAGGTGGSASHTHSNPAHNHTQISHGHGPANSPASTGFPIFHGATTGSAANKSHTHVVTSTSTLATNNSNTMPISNASSEPDYIELLGIQNKGAGTVAPPLNTIIPFVGDINTIPSPWKLCNGTSETTDCQSKQIKVTATVGNIGNTGGSNTHTHSVLGHTHTQNAHTHTGTSGVPSATATIQTSRSGSQLATSTHTHAEGSWSLASATGSNNSTVATMSTDDVRYLYREVLFIMLTEPTIHILGGAIQGGTIV